MLLDRNRRSSADASAETSAQRTRNTHQRTTVLETVRGLNGQHPSASDVYAALHTQHPHLSLATVYRALHALVEQKMLIELRIENLARYDAGLEAHHHLVCRRCGAVVDVAYEAFPPVALRRLSRQIEQTSDFLIEAHPIQFSGLCSACRS